MLAIGGNLLNEAKARELLNAADMELAQADELLRDYDNQVSSLQKRRRDIEEKIIGHKIRLEAARKALILVAIPHDYSEVIKLRNRIMLKMQKVKREDIKVSTQKQLTADIESLRKELQVICDHPFVLDKPGYEGSYENERSDAYQAHRHCVLCDFYENTWDNRKRGLLQLQTEWLFKVLVPNGKRIIEPQPNGSIDIWQPLGALLHPFEEAIAKELNT